MPFPNFFVSEVADILATFGEVLEKELENEVSELSTAVGVLVDERLG